MFALQDCQHIPTVIFTCEHHQYYPESVFPKLFLFFGHQMVLDFGPNDSNWDVELKGEGYE